MATIPGAMSVYDIQSRVLHLLREPGPDTNGTGVVPLVGDFPAATLLRDMNIWLGTFIGDAGVAPAITDKIVTLPIVAGLDYVLPVDLEALARIEYTPSGGQTYPLIGYAMNEWDNVTGNLLPADVGEPTIYREPFAGAVRLSPQPGPGNAGVASGSYLISGVQAGDTISLQLVNGATHITIGPYTVQANDTIATVASALVALINASAAVAAGSPFLSTAQATSGGAISIAALAAGIAGDSITYAASTTGSVNTKISPLVATNLANGGTADTITIYYSSNGAILVNPTDVPGIPAEFHVAIMYGMLTDYWPRKNDNGKAKLYMELYEKRVARAKAYIYDTHRSTQPSLAGADDDGDVIGDAF